MRTFLVTIPTSCPSWLKALTRKGSGSRVSAGMPSNSMVLLVPTFKINTKRHKSMVKKGFL